MSFERHRGGRWGINFISGPQHTLSTTSAYSDRSSDNASKSDTTQSRFKTGGASVPPPPSISRNSRGYSDPNEVYSHQSSLVTGHTSSRTFANLGRKRLADEDDYFLEDDEPGNLEYQPAPGSPAADGKDNKKPDSEDSDDPLDEFMADIEAEVKKLKDPQNPKTSPEKPPKGKSKGVRDDIEQEDEIESYLRFMEENPHLGLAGDDEEDNYEYDADGNIIGTEKKAIDPLPPVDHSVINYAPFAKNFYIEHEDIARLTESEVDDLRSKMGLRVSGLSPPRPVCSFAHLNLDELLVEAIRKAGYFQPTPIQSQAVPIALSGRDLIGIGKTGSGKTAAFLWPMIIHVMHQAPLKLGDGPIGVICAPTRELALQIYGEAKKLAKVYNLVVVCAYGGGSLWEQQKACEAGCEILVCTPGRLIDIIKKKSTNLRRTTYLVFDEADKMFNLGFEPQVRSIANHIRPDRQTLLFSATFKRRLERLARDILTDPVRIIQGELGEANEDITQIVEIFDKHEAKWDWLCNNLVKFVTDGSVLIFATRKSHSEELVRKLKLRDFKVLLLHGDMHQSDRNVVIQSFKRQEAPILVATDVASRGLDIPSIHTVINYEVARDIDTHTHRVGRTGRAGAKGMAYTLFVSGKDPVDFAACLVQHLESAGQSVPERLMKIASTCTWFANSRNSLNAGPQGISHGFAPRPPRARPGLGLSEDSDPVVRTGPATAAAAGEGSEIIKPGGLQIDRFNAMKAAFTAQYNRRFVSAGVEASKYTHPERLKPCGMPVIQATVVDPTTQQMEEPASQTQVPNMPSAPSSTTVKSKRSRWD